MNTKPGVQTSEFWLALLAVLGATILYGFGKIDQAAWQWVVGPVISAYTLSRGVAKKGA